MSLRIRRGSTAVGGGGGNGGEPPPSGGIYGPTNGAQAIRDGAGNRNQTYSASAGVDVTVNPGMTAAAINAALSGAGGGAVIDWAAGTYPVAQYFYLANQTWTGLGSGAIITGAPVVTPTLSGGFYRITGVTNLGDKYFNNQLEANERDVNGVDPEGMSVRANQVFWDDEKLWEVASLAKLTSVTQPYGPGNFYHDRAASIIYLDPGLGNPSGHTVRNSTISGGLILAGGTPGSQINFTIRNFTVEKAGTPPQGASDAGLVLKNGGHAVDCTVRQHHGTGLHMQLGCLVEHCTITDCGQINVHGGMATCDDAEGLEMAYCETARGCDVGYNWGWEGGESKWTNTTGLHVHHNWFHDGYGMAGPWTDGQNVNVLWEENVVEDGQGMGIDAELGGASTNTTGSGHTIRRNFVSNCGHGHPIGGSSFGAGIFVDQTRSTLVHNNDVLDCKAGICWSQQPAGATCGYLTSEAKNGYAHHNRIRQTLSGSIAAGLTTISQTTPPASSYFTLGSVLYENNQYLLDDLSSSWFKWITTGGSVNTLMNSTGWTNAGQDDGSTFELAG